MSTTIKIVAREDRLGIYFTPVIETPSGRGTMAATLSTPHGAVSGPRYFTIRGATEAVAYHEAVETGLKDIA